MNKLWKCALPLLAACLVPLHAFGDDVDLSKPQPKAANRTPVRMTGPGSERTLDLALWQSEIQVTEVIGQIERGGLFCGGGDKLRYSKKFDTWFVARLVKNFKDLATAQGFALSDRARSVFEDKKAGADFKLGATLQALDYRTCEHADSSTGSAYAKLKWEVFSARRQKVVYAPVVEGYYASTAKLSTEEFDNNFMRVLAGNLLADPKFMALVQSGGMSEGDITPALSPLNIVADKTVTGNVSQSSPALVKAVATVESGVGSGTAFYVSRAGHLLTNYHVIADAKFVRIKLSDGRSLVGEVLRSDKARDVALLQTDPVNFDVLSLRADAPKVGDEVFALGSPFGSQLVGSLSRGVLSARRVLEGVPFLQSDVAINPGSSGGPLVDASGRVIGIAQLMSSTAGVNLFIPIDEALEKLALTVTAAP